MITYPEARILITWSHSIILYICPSEAVISKGCRIRVGNRYVFGVEVVAAWLRELLLLVGQLAGLLHFRIVKGAAILVVDVSRITPDTQLGARGARALLVLEGAHVW